MYIWPVTYKVNGKYIESFATNQWIAPYNIYVAPLQVQLAHVFRQHLNSAAIVKYIFKYVYTPEYY